MQAASGLGSIVGGIASIAGAGPTEAAGREDMQIGQNNANLIQNVASTDAGDMRIANRKALGTIRANAGASGLVIEDGSPLEALMDSAATGELNVQRRLWKGNIAANNALLGGAIGQDQANQTAAAQRLKGAASILTGVTGLAGAGIGSSTFQDWWKASPGGGSASP